MKIITNRNISQQS